MTPNVGQAGLIKKVHKYLSSLHETIPHQLRDFRRQYIDQAESSPRDFSPIDLSARADSRPASSRQVGLWNL